MRKARCKDNDFSCRADVLDDIKVQKNPRTCILAWILGHSLTSNVNCLNLFGYDLLVLFLLKNVEKLVNDLNALFYSYASKSAAH